MSHLRCHFGESVQWPMRNDDYAKQLCIITYASTGAGERCGALEAELFCHKLLGSVLFLQQDAIVMSQHGHYIANAS